MDSDKDEMISDGKVRVQGPVSVNMYDLARARTIVDLMQEDALDGEGDARVLDAYETLARCQRIDELAGVDLSWKYDPLVQVIALALAKTDWEDRDEAPGSWQEPSGR